MPSALAIFLLAALFQRSPEIPVGVPRIGPAPGNPCCVRIASDGSDFFAIWIDQRINSYETRGTRVSRDGEILDPYGIPFAVGREPDIVWGGTAYIVVGTGDVPNEVVATKIDRAGRIIDGPRKIANGGTLAQSHSVAVNGSRLMAVYRTIADTRRAVIFDEALRVLSDIELPGGQSVVDMAVIPHDDGFIAVSTAVPGSFLQATRFAADGTVLGSNRFEGRFDLSTIATDGDDFLMFQRDLPGYIAATALIAGDLSSVKNVAPLPNAANRVVDQVLWAGDHYLAVGTDRERRIVFTRIERDGTWSHDDEREPAGHFQSPRAASNGTNLLLIWSTRPTTLRYDAPLFSQILSMTSKAPMTTVRPLTLSASNQEYPAIAFGNSMYAVSWGEGTDLFVTRVMEDGRSLDGHGVPVAPIAGSRIVFDGSQFVIVYLKSATELAARFLSPTRGLLQDEIIIGPASPFGFGVAASRDGALIVWSSGGRVWAAQISRSTRMLIAPPVSISPDLAEDRDVLSPAAAWNGDEYLVTWTEARKYYLHGWLFDSLAVRGTRLSADLLIRDPEPLVIATRPLKDARVASNGDDWLIAWDGDARRVQRNGAMSPSTRIAPRSIDEVVWDGESYAVSWKYGQAIMVASVSARGPIVASNPVSAGESISFAKIPLVPAGPRRVATAYARIADEEPYAGVMRVFMRVLTSVPSKRRSLSVP